jgi:hypothetical protein
VTTVRTALRTSARPYLCALVLAVVLGEFVQYLWKYVWPTIPVLFGQAPEVYVTAFGTAIAGFLWLLYRGRPTRQRWLVAFLALLVAMWFVSWLFSRLHGDAVTYAVILYPAAVIGLLWKTPSAADVLASLRFLGWLLVVILVGTRTLEMAGLIPMVDVGPDILGYEVANYWLPLSGSIGPEGRWPGPMGHNAMTGNAAAMLVVLAVGMRGRSRWVFGAVGVLVLLMTASRGSTIGAAAGVLALVLFGDNALTRRVPRRWLLVGLGGLAALALAAVLVRNPNLTGRTTYWTIAIDVWRTSPITGVGQSGITNSDLYIAGNNAHNLLIDALVKYGLVGFALVAGILVAAIVLAFRAARQSLVLPLGITAAYVVIGMAEADQQWILMSLPWLWLALSTVLAGQWLDGRSAQAPALSSGEGESGGLTA